MPKLPLLLCLLASLAVAQAPKPGDPKVERALKLHHALFTIDTHCDTPMALGRGYNMGERHETGAPGSGCQDFPRMKEGGLDASCFAVFAGQGPRTEEGHAKAKERALKAFDNLDTMFKQLESQCERALTVADLRRIPGTGKRAILVSMENGYPLGTDVANVDLFYQRGARMIGLVHGGDNELCDSATDTKDPQDRGLSEVGAKAVTRMNELGIVVDVSHASEKSFFDVLKVSKAPILASHSSARALSDHPRNLTDAQLKALKANGGVIQVCILSEFIKRSAPNPELEQAMAALDEKAKAQGGWEALRTKPEGEALLKERRDLRAKYPSPKATVKDAVDHIDHIVKVVGIDHVGIGTDFDGGGGLADCRDASELPNLTVELVRRGYSEKDLRKIWGENTLRVFEKVQKLKR